MTMAVAEDIVKGLMHRGIESCVDMAGNIRLSCATRNVTDDDRHDIARYKPEIIHYLTESPFSKPTMYVSSDLEWWLTEEPHYWADRVSISGKVFIRLTPAVLAWLKQQVLRAEKACHEYKISGEQFDAIFDAFCPIYDFAWRNGMVKKVVAGMDENACATVRASDSVSNPT